MTAPALDTYAPRETRRAVLDRIRRTYRDFAEGLAAVGAPDARHYAEALDDLDVLRERRAERDEAAVARIRLAQTIAHNTGVDRAPWVALRNALFQAEGR